MGVSVASVRQLAEEMETKNALISELEQEIAALKDKFASADVIIEKYNDYKDIIEDLPVEYLTITIKDKEALKAFFIKSRQSFGKMFDPEKLDKEKTRMIADFMAFIIQFVSNNALLWNQIALIYKEIKYKR